MDDGLSRQLSTVHFDRSMQIMILWLWKLHEVPQCWCLKKSHDITRIQPAEHESSEVSGLKSSIERAESGIPADRQLGGEHNNNMSSVE